MLVAISNQKGGIGKTTITANLVGELAGRGKRVLAVDMDPNGGLGRSLGLSPAELEETIYDVLLDERPAQDVIQTTACGADVIPSNLRLAGAEVALASAPARELRLQRALQPLLPHYDHLLIDCPGGLGLLTINALSVAERVVAPLVLSPLPMEGLDAFHNTLELVQKWFNPDLELGGIAINAVRHPFTALARQAETGIREAFGDLVFKTRIPYRVAVDEAQGLGVPACYYRDYPAAREVANAFSRLATEMEGRFG